MQVVAWKGRVAVVPREHEAEHSAAHEDEAAARSLRQAHRGERDDEDADRRCDDGDQAENADVETAGPEIQRIFAEKLGEERSSALTINAFETQYGHYEPRLSTIPIA